LRILGFSYAASSPGHCCPFLSGWFPSLISVLLQASGHISTPTFSPLLREVSRADLALSHRPQPFRTGNCNVAWAAGGCCKFTKLLLSRICASTASGHWHAELQSAEAGSMISITWGRLAANTSMQGSNPQDRIATQGDVLQQQAASKKFRRFVVTNLLFSCAFSPQTRHPIAHIYYLMNMPA
jgi:hypothetical protein